MNTQSYLCSLELSRVKDCKSKVTEGGVKVLGVNERLAGDYRLSHENLYLTLRQIDWTES
jgi:hypothetical protein